MKGKLPWWLVVILGWIVIFAAGVASSTAAAVPLRAARDTPGLLGGAWYLLLLGGAFIALAFVITIVRALASLARSRQQECALAILLPPLLLLLYNLFTSLSPLLRR
jgi:hypothetical protein